MTTASLHDRFAHHFASDNLAGALPEVLDAVLAANGGHVPSYGEDPYSHKLSAVVRDLFGDSALAFPMLTGTGANVVALQAMTPRASAVLCTSVAHIATDETGAPEHVGGIKLLHPRHVPPNIERLLATEGESSDPAILGQLTPDDVDAAAADLGNQHRPQVAAVSITQATEVGTCYRPGDIAAIAERAHHHGLLVHLDGARLPNAAVRLGCSLSDLTTAVGVDVVSLGGTKSGALGAEAIVVTGATPAASQRIAASIPFLRKASLQLASKSRFVSAQILALYGTDLWQRTAAHTNAMADHLARGLASLGMHIARPVQANAVFALMPDAVREHLQESYLFHVWTQSNTGTSEVRLMTSFDTTPEHVDDFVRDAAAFLAA